MKLPILIGIPILFMVSVLHAKGEEVFRSLAEHKERLDTFLEARDTEKAINTLEKIVQLEPDNRENWRILSLLYLESGRFYDVIFVNTRILAANSNDPIAYYDRAYAYIEIDQYSDALQDYNKAIPLYSKTHDKYKLINIYKNCGMLYGALKEYDNAINSVSYAISLNPDVKESSRFYLMRAYFYSGVKQYNNAIDDISRVIAIIPHLSVEDIAQDYPMPIDQMYAMRGSCYEELEQYNNTIKDYDKVIALNPNEIAYNRRAHVYKALADQTKNKKKKAEYLKKSEEDFSMEEKLSGGQD